MPETIMLKVNDDVCLLDKFEKFRQLKAMCDIELHSRDGRTFHAHRIILSLRCDYFSTMLSSSFQEAKQPVLKIDESAEILEELLRYIYSGVVRMTGDTAQDFLRVGNQYDIQALFVAVENYITENIDVDNCVPLIRTARQLNAKKLERGALKFVERNLQIVSKFEQMDKKDVTAMIVKEEIEFEDIFLQFLNWFSTRKDEETAIDIFRQLNFGRLNKDHANRMMQVFDNYSSCIRVIGQKFVENWAPIEVENVDVENVKELLDCSGLTGQSSKKLVLIGLSHIASYHGSLENADMGPGAKFLVVKNGDNGVLIRKKGGSERFGTETCFIFFSRGDFASFTYCQFTAEQPWCELTLKEAGTVFTPYSIYIAACDVPVMHYTPKNCLIGEVAVLDISHKICEKEVLVTCTMPLRNGRHGLLITGSSSASLRWHIVKWHEFERQKAPSDGFKARIFNVKFEHHNQYLLYNYVLCEILD